MTIGDPIFPQLNATLYQQFQNGSIVKTDCYLDITKVPMQATNLTPIDDSAFAGPEVDRWIQLDADKANVQYRTYQIIGDVQPIREG